MCIVFVYKEIPPPFFGVVESKIHPRTSVPHEKKRDHQRIQCLGRPSGHGHRSSPYRTWDVSLTVVRHDPSKNVKHRPLKERPSPRRPDTDECRYDINRRRFIVRTTETMGVGRPTQNTCTFIVLGINTDRDPEYSVLRT